MATANIYDLTDTWNDAGTDFSAIKMNVTDTASGAGSKLLDLQVGGSSRFLVSTAAGARFTENLFEQRNGTNAQTFNIYSTYTDASNYERGFARWNANVFEIGTEAAGTGSGRSTKITTGANVFTSLELDSLDISIGTNRKHIFSYRDEEILDFLTTSSAVIVRCKSSKRNLLGGSSVGEGWNEFWMSEVSSDPTDPAEGASVMWQSDGTGTGDDGDILIKVTAGGVTKTATLVDFSAV